MSLRKKLLSESETPPTEFWMSVILQLLDGDPDLSEINPNVIDFLQALINSYDNMHDEDEDMAQNLYHLADAILNSIGPNRRTLH